MKPDRPDRPGRPEALDCRAARDAAIDETLGQPDPELAERARAHLEGCAECRREVAALRATIARLRRQPAVMPSAGFRDRVRAALDDVDEHDHARVKRRERVAVQALDGFRFRLVLLGHQLKTSRKLQLRVAAALLPLLFGVGLLLIERRHARDDSVACAPTDPPPETRTPAEPPLEPAPSLPPNLVGWRPKLDEPKEAEPARPVPSFDELDEGTRKLATERLDKINQMEEDALARLRAPEKPRPSEPTSREPKESGRPRTPAATPTQRALEWLARNQRPDGSWTPGTGEPELETGVTALGLLALMAEGHLGEDLASPLDRAVVAAHAYLEVHQDLDDGRFRGGRDEAARTFSHAVACLAMVEHHVRSLAGGRLDPADAKRSHDRLERALTALEIDLDRWLDPRSDIRCAGQVGAWAALALTTARHSGVDFHLDPSSDKAIARALDPALGSLKSEQPALIRAAARTISVMAGRDATGTTAAEQDWAAAVDQVVAHPERVEPSLRFLVACALHPGVPAPTPRRAATDPRRDEWRLFQAMLETRLVVLQSPESGCFDSGIQWDCFGGGTVYETALAVLALDVGARQDAWSAARARLAATAPADPPRKR